ncbi:amino acid adenylation domain-containing protein [Pleionea sp. CnH1-48]|uniref:amino acid adenylation domain-containing protein n=1 Tax=Pleionea sp. CnH1-48 TaxID=2954494 RepID=UPI0020981175|nr:amino acid adenylation domain-containing protein [Pleionea sp. CnH1-48]MCO7227490.1 amino acid adenylation domain-containing protein [Pleionea sp. CnH1-48]
MSFDKQTEQRKSRVIKSPGIKVRKVFKERAAKSDKIENKDEVSSNLMLDKSALESLSPLDRVLFEQYAQATTQSLPYAGIHQAFEAMAELQPHATAILHKGDSISYQALEHQANSLAALLVEHGVTPGMRVGLFVQRSIPMVVGMLAVLKVGACYVPQHVGVAPPAQLAYVMDSAAINVVLTLAEYAQDIPLQSEHKCIIIDDFIREWVGHEASHFLSYQPPQNISAEDVCFVLFTSGTTGKPNGVEVSHKNLCNILLTQPGSLGIEPGTKVAQILNIAFDMAAWEIWGCLANGGTLLIREKDIQQTAEQADVIVATPSILAKLDSRACQNVSVVAVAGEPCPRPLADEWAAFCDFYNACGPTETTIVNTMQKHQVDAERLTIGKPTPNNTVYILDEEQQPCPIGHVGEMWAGGDCVTRGYLNNDMLNKDRYRHDPFINDGRKMFRTRDLGRWTSSGELEHFGRTDDQVKVRGFRVELDSVSAILESVPGCQKAVTLKLDDRHLVSFVSPQTVNTSIAEKTVESALPYYCKPAMILTLDKLPVTNRGKVDKRALLSLAIECYSNQQSFSALKQKAGRVS